MTITRTINGQEVVIELTSIELNQAYHEQLLELDILDIKEHVTDEGNLFEDKYPSQFIEYLLQKKELLAEWAHEYRELLDYGWSRSGALENLGDYMDDELDEWLENNPEFKEDKN